MEIEIELKKLYKKENGALFRVIKIDTDLIQCVEEDGLNNIIGPIKHFPIDMFKTLFLNHAK